MSLLRHFNSRYPQILFVVLAFVLMSGVSYWYIGVMVRRQIDTSGKEILAAATAEVSMFFASSEGMLNLLCLAAQDTVKSGDKTYHDKIQAIFANFDNWATEHRHMLAMHSVAVIDGIYYDSTGWQPDKDKDFSPESRMWYTGTVQSGESIHYTPMYKMLATGENVITIAKQIFDKSTGQSRGVIGVSIEITVLEKYIRNIPSVENAYVCITDPELRLIVTPTKENRNKKIIDLRGGEVTVAQQIQKDDSLTAFPYISFDGRKKVLYSNRLENGWYLLSIVASGTQHGRVQRMQYVIVALGAVCMFALCGVLIMINRAKDYAEEKDRSKSLFLAKMSHEIRTPMNTIVGMSELMLRKGTELSPVMQEYALNIKHASTSLLAIINDILDFSKIEAGQFEIINVKYHLSSLVNNIVNMIRSRMREKSLDFFVYLDSRLPNILLGDAVRIKQILLNLLSNASKYTDKGYVSLSLSGAKIDDSHIEVTLTVSDTGIGIKPEDQQHIFSEFSQVDIKKHFGREGTGLGLAITKNLVTLMGGTIAFNSVYAKGSIFTVTIIQSFEQEEPVVCVENPEDKSVLIVENRPDHIKAIEETFENLGIRREIVPDAFAFTGKLQTNRYSHLLLRPRIYKDVQEAVKKTANKSKTALLIDDVHSNYNNDLPLLLLPIYSLSIANWLNDKLCSGTLEDDQIRIQFKAPDAKVLVVDDIQVNMKVVEGLMAVYEMQMDFCTSGEEAIQLVQENDYDLVFMDHMMPKMDGIEATVIIRKLPGEKYQKLPIVALTANAMAGMREMFLQNGIDDYLPKPIEILKLDAVLKSWIPESKQVRTNLMYHFDTAVFSQSIPGVDMQKGIRLSGGSRSRYADIMKIFSSESAVKIETIRSALIIADWASYTINVHALKSALANLGAVELSARAADLEEAGKVNDAITIEADTEMFLIDLEKLRRSLLQFLDTLADDTITDNANALEHLKSELLQLKEAVSLLNAETMNSILDRLKEKEWSRSVRTLLDKLSQNILLADYDDVAILIDRHLSTGQNG
ncbi:MAG: response regulator [Planctomycetaceae bacterium]|nr:response regulator [Planctomycetaceae bacterium]